MNNVSIIMIISTRNFLRRTLYVIDTNTNYKLLYYLNNIHKYLSISRICTYTLIIFKNMIT
jgi:hypothetical protein